MNEHSLEKFLEAFGASGGFSLTITNETTGRQFRKNFPLPFAVVGRNPEADLGLFDPRVSWRHAYLQMIGGRLLCRDLQSRTGICWGDRPEEAGWVDAETGIRIGPFVLRTVADPSRTPSPVEDCRKLLTQSKDDAGLPRITLDFGNAQARHKGFHRPWQLDRVVTFVGQAGGCKVRFADPTVSGFHCSLIRAGQGLWVIDLISRACTLVNGKPLRWAPLTDKDEVQVGKFLIRFRFEEPTTAGEAMLQPRRYTEFIPPESGVALPTVVALNSADASASQPFISPVSVTPSAGPQPLETVAPSDSLQITEETVGSLYPPPTLDQSELWKSLLGPMFQQFSLMHQNMFDQFQKTLVMVVQTLNTQQQSQLGLIREELEQIRVLNKELAALQKELVVHQASAPAGDVLLKPAAGRSEPQVATPDAAKLERGPKPPLEPLPPSVNGIDALAAVFAEKNNQSQDVEQFLLPPEEPPPIGSARSEQAPAVSLQMKSEKPQPANSSANAKTGSPHPEVHRLIIDRLQAIQQKRQSLWQKIVKNITG